jgi:branched-chain amino acid transport system permease protein
MDLMLQLLLNGVILGSEYALLGIGWAIIFNTTATFHFAHGIIYTAGAYGAIFCADTLKLPLPLSIAGGVLAAVLLAMAIDQWAYQPMRRKQATSMTILITSLGILIVVENLIPIGFGTQSLRLEGIATAPFSVGPFFLTNIHVWKICVTWTLFWSLLAFLRFTRPGKALRAVGSNPEMAQIVGFNLRRMYLLAFVLGSVLAAAGAILETADTGASPHMGTVAVLIASMAVFLGGMGSLMGAALGGFFIGMAMSVSIWKIPSEWQLTVGFGVLVLVIALRPRGFLGGKVGKAEI